MYKARRGIIPVVAVLAALTLMLLVQPAAGQEEDGIFHVHKESVPPGIEREFEFTATLLKVPRSVDADMIVFHLYPGDSDFVKNPLGAVFKVSEKVPPGWTVRIDCSDTGPENFDGTDFPWIQDTGPGWVIIEMPEDPEQLPWEAGCQWTNYPPEEPPPPPAETPFVPEASTLILLGSAASGLAGYAGLQWRARRRK